MGINPYLGITIARQTHGWSSEGWETINHSRYWLQFWWFGHHYEWRLW